MASVLLRSWRRRRWRPRILRTWYCSYILLWFKIGYIFIWFYYFNLYIYIYLDSIGHARSTMWVQAESQGINLRSKIGSFRMVKMMILKWYNGYFLLDMKHKLTYMIWKDATHLNLKLWYNITPPICIFLPGFDPWATHGWLVETPQG